VKDLHAKALNFIENMKFNDICIGLAVKQQQCSCLAQILGEAIMPSDANNFSARLLCDLWNDIVQDDKGEKLTKMMMMMKS